VKRAHLLRHASDRAAKKKSLWFDPFEGFAKKPRVLSRFCPWSILTTTIKMVVVCLLGATGGCGRAFLGLALERGHTVRALARTPTKIESEHERLTVLQGCATVAKDVADAAAGCDIVVSCVGNSDKRQIMKTLVDNVLAVQPPRFYCITSLGMGGSSPTVRFLLGMFIGWANIRDYEAADKAVLDAGFTVVRPTELKDIEGTGKYLATAATGMAMKPLSKPDVGLFLADVLDDTTWDGKAVQLYFAP
jgi:NAD(P)-dependent dehydrogenase (short-subunit alcohol dehydrogenase family)